MSVLALFTSIQKDRRPWAKNLLLNSNRVSSFTKDEQSPLSKTNLHYIFGNGERGQTVEFQLSHSMNVTATRLMEDDTNRLIKLNVLAYKDQGFSREKPTTTNTEIWEVCSDNIVYAYDISTTQSYMWINRGLNFVRLLLSHTVADISRAYSTSASLSRS
jgi:hypothetical protein